MHHEVGVAADGRREVGVVVESKTIMTYVESRVHGFLHGAQRHILYEVLHAVASHVVEQLVEALCHVFLLAYSSEVEAEA